MRERQLDITALTGVIAILGHPVEHSLSPRMHNAAFRSQGVEMVYVAFDVLPGQLKYAVRGMRALGLRGANVTVPHKETVVALLDAVDPLAARVGAVNTVVNERGKLCGFNTDVAGFDAALRSLRDAGGQGLGCFVAGAGGAARAVVAALVADGAAEIWLYNRTADRARALCDAAATWGSTACNPVTERDLTARIRGAQVLVNATTVGQGPSVKESVIPVDTIESHHMVIDLVYGARPTALVAAGQERGALAVGGEEMLVMQAARSYRLWTGLEPPIDVMRKSLNPRER